MSLEALITEIATSHPVATRANRVTGITHRVGEARQTAVRAEQSATKANEDVLEAAQTAQQAGEDARQAGADVLETIRQIEAGELKTYIDLGAYISQGKLAGQISGVYIEDLAVSRAKIADAAINSAKIANLAVNSQHVNELTASKITSGDITASLVTITGRLEAGGGGVRLDSMGLALTPSTNTGSAPAEQPGRKVTNLGTNKWTALFPFQGGGVRGMGIRSDGASGGDNGRVELVSTAFGDSTHNTTGRIRVDAAAGNGALLFEGDANFRNNVGVAGRVDARLIESTGSIIASQDVLGNGKVGPFGSLTSAAYTRQLYIAPRSIAPGTTTTLNHGFGQAPDFIEVQVNAAGGWGPIVTGGYGIDIDADASQIRFTNNGSATRSWRATINNGAS